jgi:hypothetical protein
LSCRIPSNTALPLFGVDRSPLTFLSVGLQDISLIHTFACIRSRLLERQNGETGAKVRALRLLTHGEVMARECRYARYSPSGDRKKDDNSHSTDFSKTIQ